MLGYGQIWFAKLGNGHIHDHLEPCHLLGREPGLGVVGWVRHVEAVGPHLNMLVLVVLQPPASYVDAPGEPYSSMLLGVVDELL